MRGLRQGPDHTPVLYLAGPYEFLPPAGPGPKHTPALARALAAAHKALAPDLLALAGTEAAWLAAAGAQTPAQAPGSAPRALVLPVPGGEVGVILLPVLPSGALTPPDDTVRLVADLARGLAARTRLVVALSPWGDLAEDHFLRTAGPVVDILLGSGPGPGVAGRFSDDGKTFLARSYGQGKALHVIRIAAWPARTPGWRWVRDENLRLDFLNLSDAFPADPAVEALLGGLDLPR